MHQDDNGSPDGERQYDALRRVIRSFERLVDTCDSAVDRAEAERVLGWARELYGPVRELAEEVRLTHGEVPSIRAGLARIDERLSGPGPGADRSAA